MGSHQEGVCQAPSLGDSFFFFFLKSILTGPKVSFSPSQWVSLDLPDLQWMNSSQEKGSERRQVSPPLHTSLAIFSDAWNRWEKVQPKIEPSSHAAVTLYQEPWMWKRKWCEVGTAALPSLVYPSSPPTGRAAGLWRIWGQWAPHAEAQG